ncbi:MAG TPA: thioredoxin domain-containing protein [Candidatus Saccharimonadales bacterium]|nr:thioredoxin domain-containing protein [Candidatus Saccharimonadales bacterium]
MNNRFALIMAACIVAFAGIFWFNKHKTTTHSGSKSSTTQPSNHQYGDGKKAVTLIEYGDLQCPACYYYEPIVEKIRDKYKDSINFQFRNFPLVQIHQNAMAAHRAVEAASIQGKFWQMHDLLYQHAHQVDDKGSVSDIEWTTTTNPQTYFDQYAAQLGLNVSKFDQDMRSDGVNNVINADMAAGDAIGANSTPTFVLQGKKLDENPRDLNSFSKLIDDAIAAVKK